MSSDEIDNRVRSVLGEIFDLEPSQIGPETSTDTVEKWDSLQHLTLVLALEEEFGVHFADEETVALVSFPLIMATLQEHLV